jgi:hypothetical protein
MTLFKIIGTNKFFKGDRTPVGYIKTKKGLMNPYEGRRCIAEVDAIDDFRFMVRIISTETIYCYDSNMRVKQLTPGSKYSVQYMYYDNMYGFVYVCENGCLFIHNFHKVEMMPIRQPLIIQVISVGGVIMRETCEDVSKPIAFIPYCSFLMADSKEISYTAAYWDQVRFKVREGGYVQKSAVRLIGYAGSLVDYCWAGTVIERMEVSCASREKCIVCTEVDTNTTFVHGESGHSVCCLACAKNIELLENKCPVCREKIDRVILNYS